MADYKNKKQEDVNNRRLVSYPNHYYFKLSIAYFNTQPCNRSVGLNKIIKAFFDAMPPREKERLLALFDSLTPEQIKNPDKF